MNNLDWEDWLFIGVLIVIASITIGVALFNK